MSMRCSSENSLLVEPPRREQPCPPRRKLVEPSGCIPIRPSLPLREPLPLLDSRWMRSRCWGPELPPSPPRSTRWPLRNAETFAISLPWRNSPPLVRKAQPAESSKKVERAEVLVEGFEIVRVLVGEAGHQLGVERDDHC